MLFCVCDSNCPLFFISHLLGSTDVLLLVCAQIKHFIASTFACSGLDVVARSATTRHKSITIQTYRKKARNARSTLIKKTARKKVGKVESDQRDGFSSVKCFVLPFLLLHILTSRAFVFLISVFVFIPQLLLFVMNQIKIIMYKQRQLKAIDAISIASLRFGFLLILLRWKATPVGCFQLILK